MGDWGVFSVKSSYKLEGLFLWEDRWSEEESGVFSNILKGRAHYKVVAFSWKLLLNRISTRHNLAIRNILPPDVPIVCTFCDRMPESSTHLFLHCDIAQGVWLKMMGWLDCYFLIPTNMFVHWKCWDERYRNDRIQMGLRLIWHTTIWVLRKARSNKIFNNWNGGVDEIVEEIKVMSWRWMLERTNSPSCMFYEWCWNL